MNNFDGIENETKKHRPSFQQCAQKALPNEKAPVF